MFAGGSYRTTIMSGSIGLNGGLLYDKQNYEHS